ncbi:MAG: hypothetical protein JJU13_01290 [Balneolaceae bacterium]|nr:hypothetical protein [Balneolaceae bacterium]
MSGLVGRSFSEVGTSVVTHSYAAGTVSGTSQVGGLVGLNQKMGQDAIVKNSFWDENSSQIDQGIGLNNGTIDRVNPIQSMNTQEENYALQ